MKKTTSEILHGCRFTNSLPADLDICPPLIPYKFKLKETEVADLIVFAEFNEIEGPLPIMMIPKEGIQEINVNEFVVKLLSTDYQNAGSGEFEITRDTSILQFDEKYEQYYYAHYFTLFDTRARGFVRPMCLVYVSKSKKKLLTYHKTIAEEFREAIEYLRVANLRCFAQETETRIQDLQYTKECYIQMNKHCSNNDEKGEELAEEDHLFESSCKQPVTSSVDSDSGAVETTAHPVSREHFVALRGYTFSPIKNQDTQTGVFEEVPISSSPISEPEIDPTIRVSSVMFDNSHDEEVLSVREKASVLNHTSLESLALQTIDCNNGLEVINEYLANASAGKELDDFDAYMQNHPQCPLFPMAKPYLEHVCREDEPEYTPSVFVLSLMRRNCRNMRNAITLCGIGYIAFTSRIREVYKNFSKSLTTLFFEDLDAQITGDPMGSLVIGKIPIMHLAETESVQQQPWSLQSTCFDGSMVVFLKVNDSHTTEESVSPPFREPPPEDSINAFPDLNLEREQNRHDRPSRTDIESGEPLDDKSTRSIYDSQSTASALSLNDSHIEESWSKEQEDAAVRRIHMEKEFPTYLQPSLPKERPYNILERMRTAKLAGVLKQFGDVAQSIVHAVLSGRPVIISGPEALRKSVASHIEGLSTILPCRPSLPSPVLRWLTGTIHKDHLDSYKLIGLCIPERLHVQDLMSNATLNKITILNVETGHISGVAYGGKLLNRMETVRCSALRPDLDHAFQAAIQSLLVNHGLHVFLLHNLLLVTSRSPEDILKGIGLARGDWDSIKYLKGVVDDQLKTQSNSAS